MGRRKLEMKKIENLQARRVCFSKRRQGLFKKASKLSKDHNVKIFSIVFSSGNPSISFNSMIQNFLLLNNGSSSSSYSPPANDFEHCSTSSSVDMDEATIDLEEETQIEGISDSSIQFDEIEKNPNLLCTNFESGCFEEQTPIINLEGISDSSFQFGEIQTLSDCEIENPNFVETDDGFEEQSSSSFLDVEDYYYSMEEEIRSPVLVGAEEDNYGFTTDLSQIQFGEDFEFDPLLLDSNPYDATAAAIFVE